MSPNDIRQKSIRLLSHKGITIIETLPLIALEKPLRTATQIVSRMMALHIITACSYGFSKRDGLAWIEAEGIGSSITKVESSFLHDETNMQFEYYPEGIFSFAWASGFLNEVDFWNPCPAVLSQILPDLRKNESASGWFQRAVIRPNAELINKLDLAYCCHWAIRERNVSGAKSFQTNESEIFYRRLALEWLFTSDAWDEISLDT